jgi:putative transposase
MTTHEYACGVREHGWLPFPGRLWQRNYYDHVIRNEDDLAATRGYILNNPLAWALDEENPGFSRP